MAHKWLNSMELYLFCLKLLEMEITPYYEEKWYIKPKPMKIVLKPRKTG